MTGQRRAKRGHCELQSAFSHCPSSSSVLSFFFSHLSRSPTLQFLLHSWDFERGMGAFEREGHTAREQGPSGGGGRREEWHGDRFNAAGRPHGRPAGCGLAKRRSTEYGGGRKSVGGGGELEREGGVLAGHAIICVSGGTSSTKVNQKCVLLRRRLRGPERKRGDGGVWWRGSPLK